MIGFMWLTFAALLLAVCTQSSHAQVPTLSKELMQCREGRILVRQAENLNQALIQLGLSQTDATSYLDGLVRAVDACETNAGQQFSTDPPFPDLPLAERISRHAAPRRRRARRASAAECCRGRPVDN